MKLAIIGVLCLLISACWEQNEVISIESNGNMTWLVIAKPDWEISSVEGVKDDLERYASQMRKAGWSVQPKGAVGKDQDVIVGLSGSLQKVAKKTDFYKIHSVNQAFVKIEFLCPVIDDSRLRRFIKIKNSRRAAIVCDDGVQSFRF